MRFGARRASHNSTILFFVTLLMHSVVAALVERTGVSTSGLRSRLAEASTLLPNEGPGLMCLEDAFVSEQAPGTLPGTVLSPAQAIKGLYIAFNERDADKVASFLTEDCVYEDLLLGPSTVCRGRDAFINALRFHPAFVSNKLFEGNPFGAILPDVVIEVDSIAEGIDTVGVEWHVQIKGDDGSDFPFPLGRGLSQAKVCVETGKIERVVDIAEAPWRIIGVALLPLIQSAQLLLGAFSPKPAASPEPIAPGLPLTPATEVQGKSAAFNAEVITALFRALDADGSGCLDMQEIGEAAEKLGVPFESDSDLEALFSKLDANGDGRISETEFVSVMTALGSEN